VFVVLSIDRAVI